MKTRTTLLALAGVLAAFAAGAQEKVVGVTGQAAERLFTSPDAKLNRNKQTTLHIMREILQCGQWDRSAEWLTDAYHQHNPNAASGRQSVVDFFTKVLGQKRIDNCPLLNTEIVTVSAEGDYVTVIWPRTYMDPRDPANANCPLPTAPNQPNGTWAQPPAPGTPAGTPPARTCTGKTYSTTWFDTWRFVDGKADEHWDSATIAPPAR
jgi:predicted SnoaL-like aldol condensation-catalyzing enzyme